jgi:hypothetical protein
MYHNLYMKGGFLLYLRKLGQEAVAAQREHIKALLHSKKESTKRYEESLRNYRGSDDDEEPTKEIDDAESSNGVFRASSIASSITVDNLKTCVEHVRSLLEDIETLQQVLSEDNEGKDTSDHHQNLVDSFFRARGHLETVLLGNPMGRNTSLSGATLRESVSRDSAESGQQSATGSDRHVRSGWSDADFERVLLEAQEKARRDERNRIEQEARREAEKIRALAEAKAKEERIHAMKAEEEEKEKEKEIVERRKAEEATRNAAEEAAKRIEEEAKTTQALLATKDALQEAQAREENAIAEKAAREQMPLKFVDAVGRRFSFPFHLCKTWQVCDILVASRCISEPLSTAPPTLLFLHASYPPK